MLVQLFGPSFSTAIDYYLSSSTSSNHYISRSKFQVGWSQFDIRYVESGYTTKSLWGILRLNENYMIDPLFLQTVFFFHLFTLPRSASTTRWIKINFLWRRVHMCHLEKKNVGNKAEHHHSTLLIFFFCFSDDQGLKIQACDSNWIRFYNCVGHD